MKCPRRREAYKGWVGWVILIEGFCDKQDREVNRTGAAQELVSKKNHRLRGALYRNQNKEISEGEWHSGVGSLLKGPFGAQLKPPQKEPSP